MPPNPDNQRLESQIKAPDVEPEDVRTEYNALSQFYSQVIGFRFTAATIYFAGVAFVMQAELTKSKLVLMILFSVGMWLVEIRNRGIYFILGARGKQIEKDYWGYQGRFATHPFFCRTVRESEDPTSDDAPEGKSTGQQNADPIRILWFYITDPPQWTRAVVSHTAGFDLVYASVILFSLWHLCIRRMWHWLF